MGIVPLCYGHVSPRIQEGVFSIICLRKLKPFYFWMHILCFGGYLVCLKKKNPQPVEYGATESVARWSSSGLVEALSRCWGRQGLSGVPDQGLAGGSGSCRMVRYGTWKIIPWYIQTGKRFCCPLFGRTGVWAGEVTLLGPRKEETIKWSLFDCLRHT